MADIDDIQPLVVDNGTGMVKVRFSYTVNLLSSQVLHCRSHSCDISMDMWHRLDLQERKFQGL